MSLNTSQAEAARHDTGPMLVLAGPGSGKTTVITQRTKQLITDRHADPSRILVITFTKAAAEEMRTRFQKEMGGGYPVTFGTFHGVFFGILKHAYGFRGENIIRSEQQYALMREIIDRLQLEYEDEKELIQELLSEIGLIKNTKASLANFYPQSCAQDIFQKVFQAYGQAMRKRRLIDFDDMLVYCQELLTQRPDILRGWQQRFRYILIDEFQDIGLLPFEIIQMLAKPEDNLFVVGDDDQSIYRFRGAKPELMLSFEHVYPNAKRVLLDVNYRSQGRIVESALRLIGHNETRFDKKIHANRSVGEWPEICAFADQFQQNQHVAKKILAYRTQGYAYGTMAVLFRTNTQPRQLMGQLMAYNIPFASRDVIPNLYEHWVARDVLTYIRLALGSRSRADVLQIMNRPKRYLSRESLEEPQVSFADWAAYFYQVKQPWVAERVEQLEVDLRVLSRISPFAAINYIRNAVGYEAYLKEYAAYRHIKEDELLDVLDELQEGAREFPTYEAWFAAMEQYREEQKRQQERQKEHGDCVSLATLHSAKGLEYEIVFIVDVNEGVMPYKKAVLLAEQEEERRMFYVGMTRAKEHLHLYYSRKVRGREMEPSRFLKEIAEKDPKE